MEPKAHAVRCGAEVAYVVRYWPTLTETFVVAEIRALQALGVRVVVLALGDRADGALQDPLPDIEVLPLARGLALARAWRGQRSKLATRHDHAARELAARGVVRVHAHFAGEAALFAREVAARLGVPWSVTVHAVDLFKPIPGLPRLLAEARPAITVCAHHQRWIRDRYGVAAQVIRCGVSLDVPIADPSREPAQIVAIGRDVPKKGLDRLIAASRSRGASLRVIGGHPRLAGPGVQVGPARPSDVPGLLASAQLFALPVRVAPDGDRDGVPVAMMEALAAGLPVVTRPIAGVPELIDDGVGWLSTDFEAALEQALSDPAERVRRGLAARARAASWGSHESSARALLAAWGHTGPGSLYTVNPPTG